MLIVDEGTSTNSSRPADAFLFSHSFSIRLAKGGGKEHESYAKIC